MPFPNQLDSAAGRRLVAALRRATKDLPNVTETIDGFGHTTFRIGKKSFVLAGMGEKGTAISIKSDFVTQDALTRRGPYYRTRYIGQHGWISIDDPLAHDWSEVEELIADGYRLAAPRRAAARAKAADREPSPKKPKKKGTEPGASQRSKQASRKRKT